MVSAFPQALAQAWAAIQQSDFGGLVGSIQITGIRHPLHKADREDGVAE